MDECGVCIDNKRILTNYLEQETKERCSDCDCLVETEFGQWFCDSAEKPCMGVMYCPEKDYAGSNKRKYLVTVYDSLGEVHMSEIVTGSSDKAEAERQLKEEMITEHELPETAKITVVLF